MQTIMNTVLLALVSIVAALPLESFDAAVSARDHGVVQVLAADVHGPNINALQHTPLDLASNLRTFLEKYQPLARTAAEQIGAKDQAIFTSAGHCFAEYPCFTVERGAMATIGDKEEVTQEQVAMILDHLTSSPTVTFDQVRANSPLSGLTFTANQATLQVVAPRGTISSQLLAGMVFDMYKMQHDDPVTNAIRAVQAKTDNQERPFVALCLYPEGANMTQAYNFCIGSELDGQPTPLTQPMTKRLSIEHGLSFLCGFIKIPILCHDNSS